MKSTTKKNIYIVLTLVFLFGCTEKIEPDVRDPFIGAYRVVDEYYSTNNISNKSTITYDLEITKSRTDDPTAVILNGNITLPGCSKLFKATIKGTTTLVLDPNQRVQCGQGGFLELFGFGFFSNTSKPTLNIDYTIITSGPAIRGKITGTKI